MNRIFTLIAFVILTAAFVRADDGKGLYMKHCASCHHAERYGLKAPALIPETLKRYTKGELAKVIIDGLPATQMPSFKGLLTDSDVDSIISHITLPVTNAHWGKNDIEQSRETFSQGKNKRSTPPNLDHENITLVVESGRNVAVMDGNTFKALDKFKAGAIHGGPKFSYSLRYVYAPTRDGIITKYDLHGLKTIGSVKAGINTRNIAISDDDAWVAVANYLPNNIVFLTDDLRLKRIVEAKGRIGGIYNLSSDKRFLCSFRDVSELWFIDYTRNFEIEKLTLPEPFEDISIDPFEDIIVGASRKGTRLYIYSLKEKKVISSFETDGMPHLASATYWIDPVRSSPIDKQSTLNTNSSPIEKASNGVDKGTLYAAINHLKRPVVTILDLNNKKIVKEIGLAGSGFFVRTHQNTPFIWVDTNTDAIQIIDKTTLQVVKTLTPSKDKKAMHIEFTKDGRYALVSIYEEEGAVVIYDAFKLNEVMRMPFKKPAGKYNALNKTYPKIQALGSRQEALGNERP